MAVKVASIVTVWFMCAYFAVIPPAQGINCFRKIVEDGEVHNNEGEVNCLGEDDDKCGTLTFTVDSSVDVMIKNCTRSAIDCNEEEVCERITEHVENLGSTLTQCSVSCCDTDMCNVPDEKKSIIEEKLAKLISHRI